jgi:hypothetical protein
MVVFRLTKHTVKKGRCKRKARFRSLLGFHFCHQHREKLSITVTSSSMLLPVGWERSGV